MWTLQEANDALPHLHQMLATARGILDRCRQWQQHVDDLLIVHGPAVEQPQHPAHAEWQEHVFQAAAARQELRAAVQDFARAGVQLKDLDMGLVDFPARRGKDVVFLCWRDGEERVQAWHPLEGGYAARQPVPQEIQPDV